MNAWACWLRERADGMRRIPLNAVLLASGAQKDRYDHAKWHTLQGVISVTGMKFINWQQNVGGGGAIDLVIHLHGLGFKDAVHWLSHHFPGCAPPTDACRRQQNDLRLPAPDASRLHLVQRYLIHTRGLRASLIAPLIDAGRLYADTRGNAVFVLLGKGERPVGAELRGTSARSWRGMAPGTRKDLGYFSAIAPHTSELVLCESAIDAISCLALRPHALCVSTSGARASPLWLATLIAEYSTVYCGFDADPTGDAMASAMIAQHPSVQRLRPPLHDWNDVLLANPFY